MTGPEMTGPEGLLGPAEVRALAQRLGIRPTKRLGQNFVHDANTVRRIARLAELTGDDVVLEIGPGLGSLTLALLPVAARVLAVEIDPTLAAALAGTVTDRAPALAGRLTVLTADAMRLTESMLADAMRLTESVRTESVRTESVLTGAGPPAVVGAPTVLVSNLPYNVGVPVLLSVLDALPSVRHALVMIQSEVVDRMAAGPGGREYGAPSVKLAWYAAARRAGPVPRAVFWPVPGVDSALLAVHRREPPETTATRAQVFALVDAAFAQRRKALRAALAGWAGSPAAAEDALRAAGIEPTTRAERLSVADFARLAAHRPAARTGPTSTHVG